MFNMAYADILSLFIPGIHQELAAFAQGTPVSQLMLIGAIFIQIPVFMIYLSRVLKYRQNRLANMIAAVITIIFVTAGSSPTPHHIFLATIQVLCMLLIIWTAWKWQDVPCE